MPEKLGIEHLKNALGFTLSLVGEIEKAGSDGFSWTDAFGFIPEIMQVPGLVKSGKDIAAELKDLSETERDELKTFVADKFDIANDRLEATIEKALAVAFAIVELIDNMRA